MSKLIILENNNCSPKKIYLYGVLHNKSPNTDLLKKLITDSKSIHLEQDSACPKLTNCLTMVETFKIMNSLENKIPIASDIRCKVFDDNTGEFRNKIFITHDYTNQYLLSKLENLVNNWNILNPNFSHITDNSKGDNKWADFTPDRILKTNFVHLRKNVKEILFYRWVDIGILLRKTYLNIKNNNSIARVQLKKIIGTVTDYSFICSILGCWPYDKCDPALVIFGTWHLNNFEDPLVNEWSGVAGFFVNKLGYKIVKN
jgi:hypothetical protein